VANCRNSRRRGSSLLPKLWLFLAVTQQKQSSYTVHIRAALGGDGPRWGPLNDAVATSEWRDAGREFPGRRQRRWQHTVLTGRWRRFILGWGRAAEARRWRLLNGVRFQIMCFYSYANLFILGLFHILISLQFSLLIARIRFRPNSYTASKFTLFY
jgi:hypothetical protein